MAPRKDYPQNRDVQNLVNLTTALDQLCRVSAGASQGARDDVMAAINIVAKRVRDREENG